MNLFEIENNLRTLFDAIEESDGEITPEQDEQLKITVEDLKDKIDSYVNKINSIQCEVDACDAELKRIKRLKDTKKSIIERLKMYVIDAVNEFGAPTPTGNAKYATATRQLFTRKSKVVNVSEIFDDDCRYVANYVEQLSRNKQLGIANFLDDLLTIANEQEGLNLTQDDLDAIDAKVTLKCKCSDLVNGKHNATVEYILRAIGGSIDFDIDKTAIKQAAGENKLNFATIKNNTSLIIK